MMNKSEAIEAITRRNPTIHPSFLEDFSARDLQAYLDRLESARQTPWEVEVEERQASPTGAG